MKQVSQSLTYCPYQKGGKISVFGGAGVGKIILIRELIRNVWQSTAATLYSQVWAGVPVEVMTFTEML